MNSEPPHTNPTSLSSVSRFGRYAVRLLAFVGLLFILALIGGGYWVFNHGWDYVQTKTPTVAPAQHANKALPADDTPLPQGPVSAPPISKADSTSNLLVYFHASLASLQKIVNKAVPRVFAVPQNEINATGQLKRADFVLGIEDANRLKIDSSVDFNGSAKWGIFEAKTATVSLAGSSISLNITPDWNWFIAPNIEARVDKIDVSWLPDAGAGWALNNFFLPGLRSAFSNSPPIPFRPLVESFWLQSNQDIELLGEPLTVVGMRPESVSLGGPQFDQDGGLSLSLGFDVQSWAAIGGVGKDLGLQKSVPFPNLRKVSISQKATRLRLPVLICLQDAPRFFQPQTLQVPGGTLLVHSIELSEEGGICYIRARARFDVESDQTIARSFSGETILVLQARPSCDPKSGEIYFNDLAFTPKSDSILVEILGNGANAFRDQLQGFAPILSGWLKNRFEAELDEQAKDFLETQIQAWAAAVPDLAAEIKSAKPTVDNIQIKPIRLETFRGYFVLVIEASANLGLDIP